MILGLTATLQFCASADAAPSAPGAYLLQIDLPKPVLVRIAGKPRAELSTGRYFYCGSANGSGGLRSRLARHMRRGKSVHWHVDQLTEHGAVTGVWIVRNGRECDLVTMLAPLPMPVPGLAAVIVHTAAVTCCTCLSTFRPTSHGMWVFDDARVGLMRSPSYPEPTPGSIASLLTSYYSADLDMEGWLCPALFRYFSDAPASLYAQLKARA